MSEGMQDGPPNSVSYRDQLAYLFNEIYYPFIIEHVRFNEIQSHVPCMREHAAEILSIRNTRDEKAAAERFMQLLKTIPDEGNNYQELLQALKYFEYNHVVDAIEKGQIKYQHEEHKRLVSLFKTRLEMQVDAVELALPLLEKNVISSDQEKIIRMTAERDPGLAVFQLIDAIPRKHDQWFKHFWEALYSLEKYELCELLSPEWFEKMRAGQSIDDDEPSFDSYDEMPQVPELTNEAIAFSDIGDEPEQRSQLATGCQAGPRCECVAEIKRLQEQVNNLQEHMYNLHELVNNLQEQGNNQSSVVKANSDKLEEILSILKNVKR